MVIVAAIMGIIGLAMAQLMGGLLKLQKQVDVKSQRARLLTEYSDLIRNSKYQDFTIGLKLDESGNKSYTEDHSNQRLQNFKKSGETPSSLEPATFHSRSRTYSPTEPVNFMMSATNTVISKNGEFLRSSGAPCNPTPETKYTTEEEAKLNPKCFWKIQASWFYEEPAASKNIGFQVEIRPISGRNSKYGYIKKVYANSLRKDEFSSPLTKKEWFLYKDSRNNFYTDTLQTKERKNKTGEEGIRYQISGTPENANHDNVFIGTSPLAPTFSSSHPFNVSYPTQSYNTVIGVDAGKNLTTGLWNTFIGYKAGYSNTFATGNTFVGRRAGQDNTTGFGGVFIGSSAGKSNTTGNGNTFIGVGSGFSNTTGGSNTMIGNGTGEPNTTGSLAAPF